MFSRILSGAVKLGKGLLKGALSGFEPLSLIKQGTELIGDVFS